MSDRFSDYKGMSMSDIAAANQAADDELHIEEHESLAEEPNE